MELVYRERQKFGRFYYRFPNGEARTETERVDGGAGRSSPGECPSKPDPDSDGWYMGAYLKREPPWHPG